MLPYLSRKFVSDKLSTVHLLDVESIQAFNLAFGFTPQTNTADTTIWNHINANMRDLFMLQNFVYKAMNMIHLHVLCFKQKWPEHTLWN